MSVDRDPGDEDTALQDIGPLGQSVAIAFRFLFLVACLIAAGWLVSNVRQVSTDSQVVVTRFGEIARVQGAGLLLAWPQPIEQVTLLPAPARQIEFRIARFVEGQTPGQTADEGFQLNTNPRLNSGFLLTGDSSVIHLEAQVFYQITDPVAYMIAVDHVRPALQRLFIASAISVTAGRDLDSVLVARPEIASRADEVNRRERLRADLMNAVNRRLNQLANQGAGLGITISRVDLVPSIPAGAKAAFDNVLTVSQEAETGIAGARTLAQATALDANRNKDNIFTSATAAADELVSQAQTQTAAIAAMGQQLHDMSRSMQFSRLYYDRVDTLLKQAGRVQAIDSHGGIRTILPGAGK
jgi:regulator of protease activity HflC (stomatin/prohibitin superfamily)